MTSAIAASGREISSGSAQVCLRHRLDVAVEGGSAGQCDVDPVGMAEARFDDRNGFRRVVGREVQEHHVVGGRPVGGYLSRGEGVRDHAHDVRGRRHVRDPRGGSRLECRLARSQRCAVVHDGQGRRRGPSSDSRRCRAWAEGRVSLLKPPDCSAPPALGANGSANRGGWPSRRQPTSGAGRRTAPAAQRGSCRRFGAHGELDVGTWDHVEIVARRPVTSVRRGRSVGPVAASLQACGHPRAASTVNA